MIGGSETVSFDDGLRLRLHLFRLHRLRLHHSWLLLLQEIIPTVTSLSSRDGFLEIYVAIVSKPEAAKTKLTAETGRIYHVITIRYDLSLYSQVKQSTTCFQ